jgi:FPC/CPF motif-containing protein YcgG
MPIPETTYVLPIRSAGSDADDGLAHYLETLARLLPVIVVDGSPPDVFAQHRADWPNTILHLPVDEDRRADLNGKVAGVVTGLRRVRTAKAVIADDDVRYDPIALRRIAALLDNADVVRPQNVFEPLPWHALFDSGRSLIARATGGDWPGTLGIRMDVYARAGGYDGDLLFENLELVRTLRAVGGRELVAYDLFVRRVPPTASRYLSQRVRQAYDEFARPGRLAVQLALAPLLALAAARHGPRALGACALAAVALAEAGRRRGGPTRLPARRFPVRARVGAGAGGDLMGGGRPAVRARRRTVLRPEGVARGEPGAALARAFRGRHRSSASAERTMIDSAVARSHSSYHGYHDGEFVRLLETAPTGAFAHVAHAAFRAFVLDDVFSCLGAKAAIHRGTYRFGAYCRLDDPAVSEGLARDLHAFAAERRGIESDYTTYVAVFRERPDRNEVEFERALWSQLQRLHDLDARYHPWDPRVSDDPVDPAFSYSIAGNAFFVIGMHPNASRTARRFAWPTLVFNAHEQFENLRAAGRFCGLQTRIRERELRLDGVVNPNLADYGHHSEARQYSGRPVDETWTCPFKTQR